MSPAGDRQSNTGIHGILAPAANLDRWLLVSLVVLDLASAARYLDRHGFDAVGAAVLVGALVLALAYATRALPVARTWWPTAWVTAMVVLWGVLTALAPSFAWCGVPIAFAVLRVLAFRSAVGTISLMTVLSTAAWQRISPDFDPVRIAGPVSIAVITVLAYQALYLESRARQRSLDQLVEAQAELAEEQHRTGALTERTRLSREIHDSVGQGLASINLLLQAAEQVWSTQPTIARQHVETAAATSRDSLEEVRRVVRDLAPAQHDTATAGTELLQALQRICDQAAIGTMVEVRVDGGPRPVPAGHAAALIRTARGVLANIREHAAAERTVLTLTYHDNEVVLDIRDDGSGFHPQGIHVTGTRGRGLAGIRERAEALGGRADVESAPGEGTTVSVRFPLSHLAAR